MTCLEAQSQWERQDWDSNPDQVGNNLGGLSTLREGVGTEE